MTCIEQLSVLKTYFWSSFERPLKTGFLVIVLTSRVKAEHRDESKTDQVFPSYTADFVVLSWNGSIIMNPI